MLAAPVGPTPSPNDGNDELTGGDGADSFSASAGDDVLFAVDGLADSLINGGSGVDTAHYDLARPDPSAVENRVPEWVPDRLPGACRAATSPHLSRSQSPFGVANQPGPHPAVDEARHDVMVQRRSA